MKLKNLFGKVYRKTENNTITFLIDKKAIKICNKKNININFCEKNIKKRLWFMGNLCYNKYKY